MAETGGVRRILDVKEDVERRTGVTISWHKTRLILKDEFSMNYRRLRMDGQILDVPKIKYFR